MVPRRCCPDNQPRRYKPDWMESHVRPSTQQYLEEHKRQINSWLDNHTFVIKVELAILQLPVPPIIT